MISGLLVNLNSKTIDYDAVAYRTSVILAEDTGLTSAAPATYNYEWTRWEKYPNYYIVRFGLAENKNFPNVLLWSKVDAFFRNQTTSNIQQKTMMFGDYTYRFNISIKMYGRGSSITPFPPVGEPYPPNAGYARRYVKIKEPVPSVLKIDAYNYKSGDGNFSVEFPASLYRLENEYTQFQINPYFDGINISITNISSTKNGTGTIQLVGYGMVNPAGDPICQFQNSIINNNTDLDTITTTMVPLCAEFLPSNRVNFPHVYNYTVSNSTFGGTAIYDMDSASQEYIPAVMEIRVW
jgi:hypothetical protein